MNAYWRGLRLKQDVFENGAEKVLKISDVDKERYHSILGPKSGF
jgi:hypothetical protein